MKLIEKNYLKDHDMPHFEICQILLGHSEVHNNIEFIQVSILLFKLRLQNQVKLDKNGIVINNLGVNPPDIFTSGS